MAYRALYREWRPQKFEDVVGQEHITTTLKNQILTNRIAHAYLFCGTRGTGKTSTAKVFSKALNCLNLVDGEPCNECEMCKKINAGLAIDINEMDAASRNKVENIRDIIDEVQYPPQEAKYKIYIMDEAHMLTTGAVNAFLKTLEEPPSNVIFILATTDPQKLPITILSRCQRFDFKRISNEHMIARLRKIVKEQGVFADDKSLSLITRVSDGAMRDSLSILDQAISMGDGKVDYEQLVSMLGLVTNEYLFKITSSIIEKDIEKSMRTIEEIVLSGKDIGLFIKDLTSHFRNLLMTKVTNNPEEILDMSEENIELLKAQGERLRYEEIMRDVRILQEAEENSKASKQARIYLELATIKMCKIEFDMSKETLLARINRLEEALRSGKVTVASKPQDETQGIEPEKNQKTMRKQEVQREATITHSFNEDSKVTLDDVKRYWRDILERFKARRAMVIYASLSTGKPVACKNGVVEILYDDEYAFNKKRLEQLENSKIVNEVFSEILKDGVKVVYTIISKESTEKNTEDILRETIGEEALEILDE
ncbi:DNA polymerase III subunit gamma/tau [Clostridium sp. 'White wine YQ']|uniref:DNA polymerase III subunit gamma/tau n=1 Tax=Clostridium sp. 'White wine YQ' TaxID=3027474 RepID=UPI002366924B|nr:DNA polymerase III subunit gamma/tau [Clostridium sp. 'White wine YQ']MDD7796125.1 DNA polymerase III subunit gamma/tau [Clostridium sp. 'White wine YQ']